MDLDEKRKRYGWGGKDERPVDNFFLLFLSKYWRVIWEMCTFTL